MEYLAKYHMLSIKPLGLRSAEKELGAVCVRSRVRHRQNTWIKKTLQLLAISHETITWSSVLQAEVFVFKLVPIDRLAASSIASCKVASLSNVKR